MARWEAVAIPQAGQAVMKQRGRKKFCSQIPHALELISAILESLL